MSKDSSAKYYQDNKERIQRKLVKAMKVFLKKKNKKSDNMVVKDIKIYQKMKKWEENEMLRNEKKTLHYNYKKSFLFGKFCFSLRVVLDKRVRWDAQANTRNVFFK